MKHDVRKFGDSLRSNSEKRDIKNKQDFAFFVNTSK